MSTVPGVVEILSQPVWDSATIAATTSNQLIPLFRTPTGAGATTWGAAGVKTIEDTNLEQAGTLPVRNQFELYTFQLIPDLRATHLTIKNALFGGVLIFYVAEIPRFKCPLHALPAGCGIQGGIATTIAAQTPDVSSWGLPSPNAVFTMRDPVVIQAQESFRGEVFIADGTAIAVALRFRMLFQGRYTRGA